MIFCGLCDLMGSELNQNGGSGGLYHLREVQVPYNSDFTPENSYLRTKTPNLER